MVRGLGERLAQERTKLKLSQKEVAAIVDISTSAISNYESNMRTPSVEALLKLAGFYRCSTDYLLGIDKKSEQTIDGSMLTETEKVLLDQFLQEVKKSR